MKYLLVLLIFSYSTLSAQQKPAYLLFTASGKKVAFGKMIGKLKNQDLVFFGETHNNAIAHWLEFELIKDLQPNRKLMLGAEMFEADNQAPLNDYLTGKISAKGLDSNARLWKNYPTDYAPLVNFAKENNIKFIATNIPRKFASLVAKGGFEALDTLPAFYKSWIAPLPLKYDAELPGYKNMMEMMKGHGGPNLPKAQASKDATMAHFILANHVPGELFVHYNGSYHSENHDGIVWYIRNQKPDIKIMTITVVSQKEVGKLEKENLNKADFIIVVDEDMTNTY
jgi:hypothetical protein